MSENLQTLLKTALLNNSYDYDSMHNTLKQTLMNSYSYLYYLQQANIAYEELFFYSNDNDSRNSKLIGKLYLNDYIYACFDVDCDIIGLYTREEYRLSDFYQTTFSFEDLVYNPKVFIKMPIVMIDDKVIWDYKITVKKDCTTFTLPFRRNFVLEELRNPSTDDIIYKDHKIQVLVVDNIFYQRYTFNKSTINYNSSTNKIKISKTKMAEMSSANISTQVNSEYMNKWGVKYTSSLTADQKYEISNEITRRIGTVNIPTQDGTMFISLHMLNKVGKEYELGTSLIEMEDTNDGYYTGTLTDEQSNIVSKQSYKIYASMIFVNRLYRHDFYTDKKYTTASPDGADLFVLEESNNVPYKSPIPIENFMVFKMDSNNGWVLQKNTDMIELHYPNIYRIKDSTMNNGDMYKIYYFYYNNPDLQYTVLFDFYFKFLLDIFTGKSMEKIINDIYYNKADLSMYNDDEKESFATVFNKIMDYTFFHHQYGDIDFLNRYINISGNSNKEPIEYKDETLKDWIKVQPWVLRDYVLDQNKLGDSYHLFTNTLDLSKRVRTNTKTELGDSRNFEFNEERYVFAFSNEREYPTLLDCRVFVDGLLIGDVYQERHLFMDYFYIPCENVTDDSYIELEIFPRYQFTKEMKFSSLDDSIEVNIVEPEENIYPTTADLIIQENNDDKSIIYLEPVIDYGQKISSIGEILDDENFVIANSHLPSNALYIESTFLVKGNEYSYSVYTFYDEEGTIVSIIKNTAYNNTTDEYGRYLCYTEIPSEAKRVSVSIFKDPVSPTDFKSMLFTVSTSSYMDMHRIKSRIDPSYFKIISHYDRGNFEFSSNDDDKPVKFTRLSTFDIQPKNSSVLNRNLLLRFSKIPIMIRFTMDKSGYGYIDCGTEDFNFSQDYIRVFRNGRLVPKSRYRMLTGYVRPRIIFIEWFNVGDIIYIDITPYRYTQIYYKRQITKNETLINLKGIINKPFDIRYYDVYMNGRKLSLNNVFAISPWEITLVNLKSDFNLEIYEKERDWEYFGLDYNTNNYYFSLDDLIDSGLVTDEEFGKLIKDRIDDIKDERLNIYPNTFDEDPLDYSDSDMIYPIFFIFYYDELIPKTFVNPDIRQFNSTVLDNDYYEISKYYKTSPKKSARNSIEKSRKSEYDDVVFLDPDIFVESSSKEKNSGLNVQFKDKESDDYSYDNESLILDVERVPDDEEYSENENPLVYNLNNQAYADELAVELSNGAILVYDVGHMGDVDQKLLDMDIEIKDETD